MEIGVLKVVRWGSVHNSWVESVVLGRFLIRMCRIGCKQVKVVILRACEDGPRNGVGAGG